MLKPPTRARLKRILIAALIACVVLPVALFLLVRQTALELAAKNPWSKLPVGSTLVFDAAAVASSGAPLHATISYRVTQRTPANVTVSIESTRQTGPSDVVENTYTLIEPERRFTETAPIESVTTPWGTTYPRTRRVETLTADSHDVYWIDPERPLFVKHTRTTRDGVTTTWLKSLLAPGPP